MLFTPKTGEPFSFRKNILPLLSALYQSCVNKNSQIYLANSIASGFLKWILLLLKDVSVLIVKMWSMKMIYRSSRMFVNWLFTLWVLLFKLPFYGGMSNMDAVFFSDTSDWAKSIIDLDIWLAVLLLFCSFVLICSNR